MAEEKAEQAEAEIESLRARVEERDLELEILRSEAELLTIDSIHINILRLSIHYSIPPFISPFFDIYITILRISIDYSISPFFRSQEQEADYEFALLDKEMAEERAEQFDTEIELLRAQVEERDLELRIVN
ncbi:hypothetical protein P153DRAFT_384025 [Dothidotthia symphoricarpi CBS 119687]|uniref:Uncharacterized protein n=1 Tax=Dothidotthia symphoricarpi CBS 119687 TaxID=1392245 RepID=A0A6A6AG93_9PLEO|nr:uncharacterized protein P153DRAFT_384025 [Dothidotthia symphoricarpi CBS 119687]KAF2130800.1 hypothetical protein P153DRAFT_384025 [Dothidotthia symphoricarpi CBS 119687]